jgi:hypothetical protein
VVVRRELTNEQRTANRVLRRNLVVVSLGAAALTVLTPVANAYFLRPVEILVLVADLVAIGVLIWWAIRYFRRTLS